MKKACLMILSLLVLPAFLNAQGWPQVGRSYTKEVDKAAADGLKGFGKAIMEAWDDLGYQGGSGSPQDRSLFDNIMNGQFGDEIRTSGWYRSYYDRRAALDRQNMHFQAAYEDVLSGRELILDIDPPTKGLSKLIFEETEKALNKASKNGYYRISPKGGPVYSLARDWFFPDGFVELPDTPKSQMYDYAYEHAVRERQKVLDMLQRDPHGEYEGKNDDTRRGYEYHKCILKSGGLNACRSQFIEKYGEKKVREFENLLKVREEWVYYQDQNPVLTLYTLVGNHADLQYLEEEDYQKLITFFAGQEPAEGWLYKIESDRYGHLVQKSPLNPTGTVYGNDITVKISDNLEANIFPGNLSIRIYKSFRVEPKLTLEEYWKYQTDVLEQSDQFYVPGYEERFPIFLSSFSRFPDDRFSIDENTSLKFEFSNGNLKLVDPPKGIRLERSLTGYDIVRERPAITVPNKRKKELIDEYRAYAEDYDAEWNYKKKEYANRYVNWKNSKDL